jgi:hypothetical protein
VGGSSLKPTMDDFFKVIHSVLLISSGTTSVGVGSPVASLFLHNHPNRKVMEWMCQSLIPINKKASSG